jgi:hypothetical protein
MPLPADDRGPICYCSDCPGSWDDDEGLEETLVCNCERHHPSADDKDNEGHYYAYRDS